MSDVPQRAPGDDSHIGPSRRTVLAAERTWLAWFRTGIGIAAAAIGVGGILPKLAETGSSWGYVVLGAAFGLLSVGVFIEGWRRQREIYSALDDNVELPTGLNSIAVLTIAGGVLAVATVVLLFTEL